MDPNLRHPQPTPLNPPNSALNHLLLREDSPQRSTSPLGQLLSFLFCHIPIAWSHLKDIFMAALIFFARIFKIKALQRFIPKPAKVPRHLGICVECAAQVEASKLGSALAWCCAAGVETVTLYEASGFLHAPEAFVKLKESMVNECAVLAKDLQKRTVKVFKSGQLEEEISVLGLVSNGIEIRMLTAADGHQDVVNLVKRLAESKDVAVGEITEDLIRQNLRASSAVPRLDLLIVMPDYSALAHFPPELLRNAEIIKGPPIASLTHAVFTQIIASFANVEQRWGR